MSCQEHIDVTRRLYLCRGSISQYVPFHLTQPSVSLQSSIWYLRILEHMNFIHGLCAGMLTIHEPSNTNLDFITPIPNLHPPELNLRKLYCSLDIFIPQLPSPKFDISHPATLRWNTDSLTESHSLCREMFQCFSRMPILIRNQVTHSNRPRPPFPRYQSVHLLKEK